MIPNLWSQIVTLKGAGWQHVIPRAFVAASAVAAGNYGMTQGAVYDTNHLLNSFHRDVLFVACKFASIKNPWAIAAILEFHGG